MSEKELWDQSVQVTLLIHERAIVLHTTIACECPEWNKREFKSRTNREDGQKECEQGEQCVQGTIRILEQ